MRLIAFKATHFRCLHNTDWISISNLSILTGENDGGKSATLQALGVLLNPKGIPSPDDYSYAPIATGMQESDVREKDMTLWGRFELNDPESALLKAVWGIEDRVVEVKRVFQVGSSLPAYLLSAQTHSDKVFKKPLDEYTVPDLKTIATQFVIDLSGTKLKQEIVDAIRNWLNTQPKVSAEVIFPDSLVGYLPEIRIFSSETALDPESEIRKTLVTQFRSLIETDKYSGTISQIKKEIESDLNVGLEKLAPFVKQYSSDIEKVTIRPNFNFASGLATTELQLLRKDGRPILLHQSGAGQRRRCSLAVYEWSQEIFKNRDENSRHLIMAFDEPDTHLDYKSQRHIFDIIRRFAELPAMQVIVCTHSLNFIERVPINHIAHYCLNRDSRHTQIEVLSTTDHEMTDLFMYEISKNMGLRNSVMLHERCFLVIEGGTELTALPVLFYKKYGMPLQSAGVCLVNGEGNYGARMFVKFLNTNKRQVIFLVDTDAVSTSGLQKHFTPASFKSDGIDEATQVHYVGTKEFEDAFSDEVWARMSQAFYPKKSGTVWTIADFTALRAKPKFSKEVQSLISIEGGLSFEPPKPDLGYMLAQVVNVTEIPAAVAKCLEESYRLANL